LGGTHELPPAFSEFTLTPYTPGAALPTCSPLTSYSTGVSYFSMCSVIQGPDYQSVMQAVLTANSATEIMGENNQTAYLISAATGVRNYTNLATGATQSLQLLSLMPPHDPVGGNSNFIYPEYTPLLDGDGLTFQFNDIPMISGRMNNPNATTRMNYWSNIDLTLSPHRCHCDRTSSHSFPAADAVCVSGSRGRSSSTWRRTRGELTRRLPSSPPFSSSPTPPAPLFPSVSHVSS
jgi:hypothetical protein